MSARLADSPTAGGGGPLQWSYVIANSGSKRRGQKWMCWGWPQKGEMEAA